MKYRIKIFKPEYFSGLQYQTQYKYPWWPFWFNGPKFNTGVHAARLWCEEHKSTNYPRYVDVD